jgi:hypothetical protein
LARALLQDAIRRIIGISLTLGAEAILVHAIDVDAMIEREQGASIDAVICAVRRC